MGKTIRNITNDGLKKNKKNKNRNVVRFRESDFDDSFLDDLVEDYDTNVEDVEDFDTSYLVE